MSDHLQWLGGMPSARRAELFGRAVDRYPDRHHITELSGFAHRYADPGGAELACRDTSDLLGESLQQLQFAFNEARMQTLPKHGVVDVSWMQSVLQAGLRASPAVTSTVTGWATCASLSWMPITVGVVNPSMKMMSKASEEDGWARRIGCDKRVFR